MLNLVPTTKLKWSCEFVWIRVLPKWHWMSKLKWSTNHSKLDSSIEVNVLTFHKQKQQTEQFPVFGIYVNEGFTNPCREDINDNFVVFIVVASSNVDIRKKSSWRNWRHRHSNTDPQRLWSKTSVLSRGERPKKIQRERERHIYIEFEAKLRANHKKLTTQRPWDQEGLIKPQVWSNLINPQFTTNLHQWLSAVTSGSSRGHGWRQGSKEKRQNADDQADDSDDFNGRMMQSPAGKGVNTQK